MKNVRRGSSLLEIMATTTILAALTTFAAQGLVLQQAWRSRAEARSLALLEADSALEQFAALGWDDLTAERLASAKLSDAAQRILPGATLKARLDEEPGPPAAKRLRVEIAWPEAAKPTAPVQLVTWIYRHGK